MTKAEIIAMTEAEKERAAVAALLGLAIVAWAASR